MSKHINHSRKKGKPIISLALILSVVCLALTGCDFEDCPSCERKMECQGDDGHCFYCERKSDGLKIKSCYVREGDCYPEWCSLPLQDCDLPPRTDGIDSCGEPCSKPSPMYPYCYNESGERVNIFDSV